MRALLTGGSGFAGRWLAAHLRAAGDEVECCASDLDVRDADAVSATLQQAAPEVVYHLAALTHVGRSFEEPAATFAVNALGTLNLLEAVRKLGRPAKVVLVSSSEVYGQGAGVPLDEHAELRPVSPYAASKVAAEFLGVQAAIGRGLDVVRVRPFNHVGPGQDPNFVVSAIARRVALAEAAGGGEVPVGNLGARRDFTDVRDVVRAYRLVAMKGEPGEVYNVCSETTISIAEIAQRLAALAHGEVRLVTDPALVRPIDVAVIAGDATRLRRLTNWAPRIELSTTLAEVLEHWRRELRGGRPALSAP